MELSVDKLRLSILESDTLSSSGSILFLFIPSFPILLVSPMMTLLPFVAPTLKEADSSHAAFPLSSAVSVHTLVVPHPTPPQSYLYLHSSQRTTHSIPLSFADCKNFLPSNFPLTMIVGFVLIIGEGTACMIWWYLYSLSLPRWKWFFFFSNTIISLGAQWHDNDISFAPSGYVPTILLSGGIGWECPIVGRYPWGGAVDSHWIKLSSSLGEKHAYITEPSPYPLCTHDWKHHIAHTPYSTWNWATATPLLLIFFSDSF